MSDDEWHSAVRGMTEIERNSTEVEVRTAAGVNPYDEASDNR